MVHLTELLNIVKTNGAIQTVRVSSAQARGFAKKFSYWGAARYEIRICKSGKLSNVALERASSDRRSKDYAKYDAEKIAKEENRIIWQNIGEITEQDAEKILAQLQ